MARRRLAVKIAAGYMAVILITALIMAASFYPLMKNYIYREVRVNLEQDAENISLLLEKTAPEKLMSGKWKGSVYRLAGQLINGECLVLSEEDRVLFSTLPKLPLEGKEEKIFARKMKNVIKSGNSNVVIAGVQYIAVARPFKSQNVSGWVVTMARPENLRAMTRRLSGLFLECLSVSSAVAVLLTLFLASRMSRNISLLRDKAYSVARRKYGPAVSIDSGDELQDLGEAFNSMEQQIREYDEAQKKFFQNASHELKTPLMSIQGYAEGVRDGTLKGEEANRALEVIGRECVRLKSIVEDLIYMGRLDSPSEIYKFEAVDMEEVIRQSLETVDIMTREKGIAVEVDLGSLCDAYVRADGEKLVRVFVNLLGNALRYAKKKIKVEGALNGDKIAVIRVIDDGEGFVEAEINMVWNRFYKGPGGVSGLGLAIVHSVVTAHGGAVRAYNMPSGGAVAEISLGLYRD